MNFIDTHQHLIYHGSIGYSWTDNVPVLAGQNFTLPDYNRLVEGHGIAGTVFMEAGVDDADYQTEARFIAGLVGSEKLSGLVASCRPEYDAGFDAWLEEATQMKINGFRRILHDVPDDVSTSQTFRHNVRKIGRAGLPFDLCFLARQHHLALGLLSACPDQQFILDHFGNPDVVGGGFVHWAHSMKQIATFPNVVVKMSGIAVNCGEGKANLTSIKPYFEHMIEWFGADRIVWGSDWPVVNKALLLGEWIDMSRQLLGALTPSEQRKIAYKNAIQIYVLKGFERVSDAAT
jgi:predicted TIM-barrel fold metal-dependent hydrolase